MLIDDSKEYDLVWNKVYEKLKFKPVYDRGHSLHANLPFEIQGDFAVYGIEKMTDSQIDAMEKNIKKIFVEVTEKGNRMYALDWQHSVFLFDPRKKEEQKSFWKEDNNYFGGGYNVYFPSLYPDGDYHFFIDESFEFGYLGHPWRQEIWVFGDKLINKINEIYKSLGWIKIR